jgi:hypothetical protein
MPGCVAGFSESVMVTPVDERNAGPLKGTVAGTAVSGEFAERMVPESRRAL